MYNFLFNIILFCNYIMASKIIELRQAEADKVFTNGDYDISLKYTNDLIVEEGDQIMVKNIFVDTLAQSNQKINIPQELTLLLEHYFYYIFTRTDQLIEWNTDGSGGVVVPPIDAKPYIVGRSHGNLNDIYKITGAKFPGVGGVNPAPGGSFTVSYKNPAGQQATYKGHYPAGDNGNPTVTLNFGPIFYDDGETPTITADGYPNLGLTPSLVLDESNPTDDLVLEPITLTTEIKLPAGNYSPDELVAEFNRIAQSARKGSIANEVYENNFLKTSGVLEFEFSTEMYGMREDGLKVFQFDQGSSLILGASFVELAYIESQQQFSFEYIHQPFYQDATTVSDTNLQVTGPAIASVGYKALADENYVTVNKNTGILFKSLTSTYADGTDAKFFEKILGFKVDSERGSLVSLSEPATYTDSGGTVSGYKFDKNPLVDGVNITGGYIPLSAETNLAGAAVPHAEGQPANPPLPWWQSIDPIVSGGGDFFSATDDTYNILGTEKTTQQDQFRYGYYLVSITGDFRSQFYGKEIKQNVMAIVSRYYESNSFTSGTSDDSVIYVHSGAPINLQKFNVKILKPDKTLAENLGPQSAIYLEIVKAGSQ